MMQSPAITAELGQPRLEAVLWPTWTSAATAPRAVTTPWASAAEPALPAKASLIAAAQPRPSRPAMMFDESELAHACAAAAASARAAALAEAAADRAQRELDLLAKVAERVDGLAAERRERDEAARARLLELGLTLTRALGAAPIDPAVFERVVAAMLAEAEGAEKVRVEVHASLADEIEARLAKVRRAGPEITVVAQEDVPPGDVRLRWADGWAERRRDDIEAALGAVLRAWAPPAGDGEP